MQVKPENNPYFTATYEEIIRAARFATVGLFNGVEVLIIEPALARALGHLGLTRRRGGRPRRSSSALSLRRQQLRF